MTIIKYDLLFFDKSDILTSRHREEMMDLISRIIGKSRQNVKDAFWSADLLMIHVHKNELVVASMVDFDSNSFRIFDRDLNPLLWEEVDGPESFFNAFNTSIDAIKETRK